VPTPASDHHHSSARAIRIAFVGVLAAGAVSVLTERDRGPDADPSDLDYAIPVPATARLVERRIDFETGRSIAVLDIDPTTPPAWNDTCVLTRRRDLPGVQMSFATEPVEVPGPSASIDAWRAFAAGAAVRLEPHGDAKTAVAAFGVGPR